MQLLIKGILEVGFDLLYLKMYLIDIWLMFYIL